MIGINQEWPNPILRCPIAPGSNMIYDFTVGNQTGTYWYHSHSGTQYGDGLRGMFIIEEEKDNMPFHYDEAVELSLSDHYHMETSEIMKQFMSRFNPTGAEPIPQNSLFNETRNVTFDVRTDTTYLLRVVNMGLFASQYLFIENHTLTIVEVDGVPVVPYDVDSLYITVGQRYGVLVKTKSTSGQDYRFVNILDKEMLDTVPQDLQLVSTNYLRYNNSGSSLPKPLPYQSFEETLHQLKGYDDFDLVPISGEKLLPDPDLTIQLNLTMEMLNDGVTYAMFNGKTYTPPKVPTLYTLLSSNELATNEAIYGTNTNSFILQGGEVVDLVLNNVDDGKHPFHLHGHNFQVISRSEQGSDPIAFDPNNKTMIDYPEKPLIRDTVEVKGNGFFVIRFVAENPGIWFFHCHVDWHLEQGLAIILVEDPFVVQQQQQLIPDNHLQVCKEVGVLSKGNAAGNEDFLNLQGQNVQRPPLPEGFTSKGYFAIAVCALAALYGSWSIYNYGMEDVSQDNSAEVMDRFAGIVGLYTVYTLLDKGIDVKTITVIADYFPGDESINYTSPYAGGNFSCITGDDDDILADDKYTYLNLAKVQSAIGKTAGLDRYISTEYWDTKPSQKKINSLKSYLEDYKELKADQLPTGSAFGISFLSWNFNCPKFLYHFKTNLEERGVQFQRKHLDHIVQAYESTKTSIVFNCTGLGARTLVGDKNVYPGRGQVVVVRAPHIMENVLSWGDREPTYIIKRPYSHDQLILGGFYQRGDWTPDALAEQTADILKRTTTLYPKILTENPYGNTVDSLEVIRVAVGLRPCRHGGARIERVMIEGRVLIHNYGAAGNGYQSGLGMAHRAVKLAIDVKL
ncbi:hypothetical protein KGF56_002302 [Candida oxycetoniae]|uniref:Uncharacterized protein n=1 Tax=Candida oxycetoniae TaxID=497107 RepID=A0AAI9SY53_9ASCO|nr:uncharacterized protein KGF56_002302 [Candida oxycetoniae]KAI3404886.2 hypothetical protein KGF56_002302 [Candida oxycetoniae]